MKQILQNLGSGETILADVPCPRRSKGHILIQSTSSLVSLGTEKMLIEFGKGGYLAKAKSQPDKVKQVLQKIQTDGLWTTLDAVRAKLDQPIPLGYCNVGRVVEHSTTHTLQVGDRVVSNGHHAEFVSVPENLTAKIPDEVSDESASYTVVAAIGLQGIRLAAPTLGERFVVSGLGLIGLLTVQMLRAQGCEVLGIDFDEQKLDLAKSYGAATVNLSQGEDPIRTAHQWTQGQGVDGVLITASNKSDELIHQAATMCRKRGRIILIGVIGLNLRRSDFYEKELTFQVSCSYGPGRYDPNYEKLGLDYPIGYVRWTEQRNFMAVLQLLKDKRIDTDSLTTHRYPFDEALEGYKQVHQGNPLGVLLRYSEANESDGRARTLSAEHPSNVAGVASDRTPVVAFIGAGAFTTRMLLPCLSRSDVDLHSIVSSSGVSASYAAKKFGFRFCSTDSETVMQDDTIDAVFITTPHNTHADLVRRAVESGKHVFVEKPLAMTVDELTRVQECLRKHPDRIVLVGFNRRFARHTQTLMKWLSVSKAPKSIVITVNAGEIPSDHWTQDRTVGGGRIIGEACHFIDLARHIASSPIASVSSFSMGGENGRNGDIATIQLSFDDGSIATVHYFANGSKAFPKERVEVFCDGQVYVIDNFRRSFVAGKRVGLKTRSQDKGHASEVSAFLNNVCRDGMWPIPMEQLIEVSRATIEADQQIRADR